MPPLPKDPSTRARRNKTAGARQLTAVAAGVKVPALPERAEGWSEQTQAWWRDTWRSPMAPEYDDSDRHGILMLAYLVEDFFGAEDARTRKDMAAEIRQQSQRFGLSPLDRRRLQWEIDRGDEAEQRTKQRQAAKAPPKPRAVDPRAALAG
jgi:hypothetical protein